MKRKDYLEKILPIFTLILIAISIGVIFLFLSKTKMMQNMELRTIDYRFVSRNKHTPISPEIIIIALDAGSFEKIKEPFFIWPAFITEVAESLVENDAGVVGIDVLQSISYNKFNLKPPLDKYTRGQTKRMQRLLLSGKIVLISILEPGSRVIYPIDPIKALALPDNIGISNLTPDSDEVIRKQAVHIADPTGKNLPCFPYVVTAKYLGGKLYQGDDLQYRIGETIIRDDNGYMAINYAGPPDSFETIPFWKVLRKAREGDNDYFKQHFKGRIVLFGRTDYAGKDFCTTPFNVVTGDPMSGIELQANIINTILQKAYITRQGRTSAIIILFLFCIFTSFLCYFKRPFISAIISAGVLILYVGLAFYLFSHNNYVLSLVAPVFSIPAAYGITYVYRYLTVDRKMKTVRDVFGKLVSPSVEEELWQERIEAEPGMGEEKIVTVLFADITGFSDICDKHPAHDVMKMLNEYYTEMVEIAHKNRGTVKQFVGDEIMVMYGTPGEEPHQALLAIKTAVEMVDRLNRMEKEKEGEPGFYKVKIGIHTGKMKVGFIGSKNRMEYTGVGKSVNIAARFEQLNKELYQNCPINLKKVYYDRILGSETNKGEKIAFTPMFSIFPAFPIYFYWTLLTHTIILISDDTHNKYLKEYDKIVNNDHSEKYLQVIKSSLPDIKFKNLGPRDIRGITSEKIIVYQVTKEGW
ncbi:MAG: adenylate/guanylate cyclase domain-containing protein [Candidatus Eremiobacteraeota bacterium]|nr:adenylate/guanylate cyclase domain-containing protein [Candidatus Eremiobacteraeota bacterium]